MTLVLALSIHYVQRQLALSQFILPPTFSTSPCPFSSLFLLIFLLFVFLHLLLLLFLSLLFSLLPLLLFLLPTRGAPVWG